MYSYMENIMRSSNNSKTRGNFLSIEYTSSTLMTFKTQRNILSEHTKIIAVRYWRGW